MADYLTKLNAAQLISALEEARHTSPQERAGLERTIRNQHGETELPVILRVLAGVGAFIASMCLMGFLSISKIIDFNSAGEMLAWGLGFVGGGIALTRAAANRAGTALHSFLMQWSFCLVGLGKMLTVGGAMELAPHDYASRHDELWYGIFALAGITAAGWNFYRLSVDRFLSSLGVLAMITLNIFDDAHFGVSVDTVLQGLALAELCFAAVIFTGANVGRSLRPLGYALAVALSGLTLFFAIAERSHALHDAGFDPFVLNAALAGALIALIGWAAGGLQRLKEEPFLIASLGVMLLAWLGAPGLLLSLGFLVLGHATHDRLLIRGGALLLPAFLGLYYYNLDLTLLAKSAVLVVSGGLLLAGRYYMRTRKFDKEA